MVSTYSDTRTMEMPYAEVIKRELGYNKVLLFDEIPENWITYYRQKAVLLVFKYEVRHESKTYHVFSMHGYHMRHKVRNEVTRAICDGRRYTENEPFRILSVDTFAMCSVSMKSNSGNGEVAEA